MFCAGGTNTIIHGRRAKGDKTVISNFKELNTATLIDQQMKMETFNRLHSVLRFLFLNVAAERSYILRGCKAEITKPRSMRLFEVIDEKDKKNLTFITNELLRTLSVDK